MGGTDSNKRLEVDDSEKKSQLWLGVIVTLVILIIILLILAPDNRISETYNSNINQTNIVKSDAVEIEGLVEGVTNSDIEIISNQNNTQADVILSALNIDIRDIYSYAGSIDPRLESSHAILIVRPKPDKMEQIKTGIRTYLFEKQSYFENSGLMDSPLLKTIESAILYNTDDYVVLVMEENPNKILLEISKELRELENKEE